MPQETQVRQHLDNRQSTDILAVARERSAAAILTVLRNRDELVDATIKEWGLAYADAAISEFLSVLQEIELPESAFNAANPVIYRGTGSLNANNRELLTLEFRAIISELSRLHKEGKNA